MVRVPGVTKGATVADGITDRGLHRFIDREQQTGRRV